MNGLEIMKLWRPFFVKEVPRKEQIIALNNILYFFEYEGGDVFLLNAPTGIGKSIIGLTLARYYNSLNKKTSYVVSTKILENQLLKDCKGLIVKTLGRNNFNCLYKTDNGSILKADEGLCAINKDFKCEYSPVGENNTRAESFACTSYKRGKLYWQSPTHCPYWDTKVFAINSPIVVHNYYYYLYENNYIGDFGPRYLTIFDEGHNIEKIILNFLSFNLSELLIEKYKLPISRPIDIFSVYDWTNLLRKSVNYLEEKGNKIKSKLTDKEKVFFNNFCEKIKSLYNRLNRNMRNWVVIYEKRYSYGKKYTVVKFKPIFISNFVNNLLLQFGKKILIMSATLLSEKLVKKTLGLNNNFKVKYLSLNSPFPKKNRLIYIAPIINVNYKNRKESIKLMTPIIKKILSKYKSHKGIIHTHSYSFAKGIYDSIHSNRLLLHDSKNKELVIRDFIKNKDSKILVSPSVEEGFDLKDDLCRFIIITKVPYPDLSDLQIKQRMKIDPIWYQWITIQTIIQMAGRGVRHKNDWCYTYILDGNFINLLKRNRNLFPSWFLDSLIYRN